MTDSPRQDPHDGWTPEPQVEVQPGDPWRDPSRPSAILAIEAEAAQAARAEIAEKTAGEVADWLDSYDGRVADIMELWTTGKRTSRWAGEQLIDEGHLARLIEADHDA